METSIGIAVCQSEIQFGFHFFFLILHSRNATDVHVKRASVDTATLCAFCAQSECPECAYNLHCNNIIIIIDAAVR